MLLVLGPYFENLWSILVRMVIKRKWIPHIFRGKNLQNLEVSQYELESVKAVRGGKYWKANLALE